MVQPTRPATNPEGATKRSIFAWCDSVIPTLSDNPTHPSQIALRTYALALSFSLGPALIPFLSPVLRRKTSRSYGDQPRPVLVKLLKRELGVKGFAFAFAVAVAGGAVIQHAWHALEEHKDPPSRSDVVKSFRAWLVSIPSTQKSFLSNLISSTVAAGLLSIGSRPTRQSKALSIPWTLPITGPQPSNAATSSTLDLTLLLVVRAFDVAIQSIVFRGSDRTTRTLRKNVRKEAEGTLLRETLENEKRIQEADFTQRQVTAAIDAFIFWGCSARFVCLFAYSYSLTDY